MSSQLKLTLIGLVVFFQLSAVIFIWINISVTYWLLAGYAITLITIIGMLIRERRKEKKEEDNDDYRDY
ncbi:hypothetical protein [Ammoniphilus sp. 3BR4]|uniref:hypothetical protein n=1 Tax=Ammoniphilus sp. 3BR4 TaxID=3158265 RepID=UPI0034658049